MTLFVATIVPAFILLALGIVLFWGGEQAGKGTLGLLRNRPLEIVVFMLGAGWFLYEVTQLGEADFGNHSDKLFIFFGLVAIGSAFYLPDFLGVRGVCVITLMAAAHFLEAAYMKHEIPSRLTMVAFVYACIVGALYFGALPYRMRDLVDWLYSGKKRRHQYMGIAFLAYGALLLVVALTYNR